MNINPKQIQGMMKKMGISQVPIDAKRVIIECEDHNIVLDEPSVLKVNMQGQKTYQISGEEREESTQIFSEEDIVTVVEKTGRTKEEVRDFLEKNEGDIALAILELKQ